MFKFFRKIKAAAELKPAPAPALRPIPVVKELKPEGLAATSYPSHLNFRDEVPSLVASDALNLLMDNWYGLTSSYTWSFLNDRDEKYIAGGYRSSTGKYLFGGQLIAFVRLSDEWVVAETDGCMDFTDVGFYFRDELIFQVGHKAGKVRSGHDLHEVFCKELRDLINKVVLEYEAAKPAMKARGIYVPGLPIRRHIREM